MLPIDYNHPLKAHRPDLIDSELYVITAIFNPKRFRSRWKHYKNFEQHIINSGANLVTIECSFGSRSEVITEAISDKHQIIHVSTVQELWLKENLINVAIQHLPKSWKYVAWIDADITFVRHDWVGETLQLLQHFPIIQMYSQITQLGPNEEPMNTGLSFMEGWRRGIPFQTNTGKAKDNSEQAKYGQYGPHCKKIGWAGSPGGAWAATRDAVNKMGGLIDIAILGSGDYHMAAGLMGFMDITLADGRYHPEYVAALKRWESNAIRTIKRNVGHMKGLILHHFHGKMSDRGYTDRWKILVKHQFNPLTDIRKDSNGVYQLNEERWELRDELRNYFSSRNEDSIDFL